MHKHNKSRLNISSKAIVNPLQMSGISEFKRILEIFDNKRPFRNFGNASSTSLTFSILYWSDANLELVSLQRFYTEVTMSRISQSRNSDPLFPYPGYCFLIIYYRLECCEVKVAEISTFQQTTSEQCVITWNYIIFITELLNLLSIHFANWQNWQWKGDKTDENNKMYELFSKRKNQVRNRSSYAFNLWYLFTFKNFIFRDKSYCAGFALRDCFILFRAITMIGVSIVTHNEPDKERKSILICIK